MTWKKKKGKRKGEAGASCSCRPTGGPKHVAQEKEPRCAVLTSWRRKGGKTCRYYVRILAAPLRVSAKLLRGGKKKKKERGSYAKRDLMSQESDAPEYPEQKKKKKGLTRRAESARSAAVSKKEGRYLGAVRHCEERKKKRGEGGVRQGGRLGLKKRKGGLIRQPASGPRWLDGGAQKKKKRLVKHRVIGRSACTAAHLLLSRKRKGGNGTCVFILSKFKEHAKLASRKYLRKGRKVLEGACRRL